MMHTRRRWSLSEVPDSKALAKMLSSYTYSCCTAFVVVDHPEYLFLNDATSPSGAQEYAVVRGGLGAPYHVQVESITFDWCTTPRAYRYIEETLRGRYDLAAWALPVHVLVELAVDHTECRHCMW